MRLCRCCLVVLLVVVIALVWSEPGQPETLS